MKFSRTERVGIASTIIFTMALVWLWHIVTDFPQALEPNQHKPAGVLIDNVRLISMEPGAPDAEDDLAVLVVGDRIVQVGAAGELLAPEGVLTVDASGHSLIPGLIDAHIHLSDEAELAGYLAHGVTGLRNVSGYPFYLSLSERNRVGRILGPDFVTTGPILNSPGPNENLLQQTVTTDAEARAAVRAQYDAGYRRLKLYSNLTRDAFDAIVDEAGKLGMQIMGHTPEGQRSAGMPREKPFEIPWEATLGRGFTTFEHVETLVWHLRHHSREVDGQGVGADGRGRAFAASGAGIGHAGKRADSGVRENRRDCAGQCENCKEGIGTWKDFRS